MSEARARSTLWRYAALAVPLAFVGLPIYVHVPKFYGQNLGMDLALLGAILLGVRLFDCFLDPLIGWARDRYPTHRRSMLWVALVAIMLGYTGTFNPTSGLDASALAAWLIVSLLLVYVSFSVLMIHYYASGVALANDGPEATRVSTYRETAMLMGVLLASILPALLTAKLGAMSFLVLAAIFSLLLLMGAWLTLRLPVFLAMPTSPTASVMPWRGCVACLRAPGLRHVLLVMFCNAIPSAITGTLFLFYTADVLKASDTEAGLFLVLYFVAAASAISAWGWLARRIGMARALACGMVMAIISFMFAYGLGAGQLQAFAVICAFSGIAVGADLALLPAMFAQRLSATPELAGVGFGLWHFLSKLTLALAAGISLPLLAIAGYTPGGDASLTSLSLAYALIPCLLKLLAIYLLLCHAPKKEPV